MVKLYLFQHLMEVLIKPIKSGSMGGIDLRTNDGMLWCYPFLSELLRDLPEHHIITLTFNSANCKMPCYSCITPKNDFNNPLMDQSMIQLRTPKTMQNVLRNDTNTEYSLHNIENIFWKLP